MAYTVNSTAPGSPSHRGRWWAIGLGACSSSAPCGPVPTDPTPRCPRGRRQGRRRWASCPGRSSGRAAVRSPAVRLARGAARLRRPDRARCLRPRHVPRERPRGQDRRADHQPRRTRNPVSTSSGRRPLQRRDQPPLRRRVVGSARRRPDRAPRVRHGARRAVPHIDLAPVDAAGAATSARHVTTPPPAPRPTARSSSTSAPTTP